jgi:ABC-2 type transport system permease protein
VTTTRVSAVAGAAVSKGLGTALLRHSIRLVRTGVLVVLTVAAGMSAVVVGQHRNLYGNSLDAASLQVIADNPAIRIMFGAPVALQDPGGFTVWRTGTPIAVLVAVWALMTTVRLTRGDEESGRWDLLLAGRYRLGGLVTVNLTVVVSAAAVIGCAVASAMVIAGAEPAGATIYGAVLALIGAVSAAWGALAGQLIPDRRRAAALAVAAVGAGFLARMVADGVESLSWLHWVTSFGLLSLTEPFAAQRLAPLAVLLGALVILVGAVLLTSRQRDLNAGLLAVRVRHRPHTFLLRSLSRHSVSRTVGAVIGWGIGLALYFLVVGLLASSLTQFLTDNPTFADLAAAAGFGSLSTVNGYVASMFTILAVPLGLFAASRISATASDEEARRLTTVFAAPVSRTRFYFTEAATALTASLVLAVTAAVAAWIGTNTAGSDISFGSAVAGAINVTPIMLLSLAAGLLALGWAPQAVLPIGAVPSAGGFLLQVLAETLQWPDAIKNLSPFTHVSLVPHDPPNWNGAASLTITAAAVSAVGLYGFTRRDLRG